MVLGVPSLFLLDIIVSVPGFRKPFTFKTLILVVRGMGDHYLLCLYHLVIDAAAGAESQVGLRTTTGTRGSKSIAVVTALAQGQSEVRSCSRSKICSDVSRNGGAGCCSGRPHSGAHEAINEKSLLVVLLVMLLDVPALKVLVVINSLTSAPPGVTGSTKDAP